MFWLLLEAISKILSFILIADQSELVEFCQNAQKYFAPQRSLIIDQWSSSLPTDEEKEEMRSLLTILYNMNTFEGKEFSLKQYSTLNKCLTITKVKNWIIIHEKFPIDGALFPRNFGLIALCEPTYCKRFIHHSAVHFDSEGPIYEQAVRLAQMTKSRSVTLHGASRYALKQNDSSSCQAKYSSTDGAHTINTMFFHWSSLLLELSRSKSEDFLFVQWHGMSEMSCLKSDAFLSSGTGSASIYTDSSIAVRVKEAFNSVATGIISSVPTEDKSCKLIASDNPLGRLINGVKPENICKVKANEKNIKGNFLHIEQKMKSIEALNEWKQAFELSFHQ